MITLELPLFFTLKFSLTSFGLTARSQGRSMRAIQRSKPKWITETGRYLYLPIGDHADWVTP
jgi:hypothetical protein